MRHWTHEELHALINSDSALKIKSGNVHALLRVNSEQKEQGKLQMMELYAQATHCKQINTAKEYVKKVFECLRQEKALGILHNQYISQKLCHSPLGNDYICFCNETC